MATTLLHPSELAYAFSYSKTESVIGWGSKPFAPTDDPKDWFAHGEERLIAAGRLVGRADEGLAFTDEMTAIVLALANPTLVLLAQRKDGDGVRTLTVHAAKDDFCGLTHRPDGQFELTRYAELTAAAGACASFVGATLTALERDVRVEANHEVLSKLDELANAGQVDKVIAALVKLGASENDAKSAILALARPTASGVVSTLYCAGNEVQDAETYSVLTNKHDHTWVIFPPASLDGPMVLERSSVGALTARVAVTVAARMTPPQ